MLDHQSWKFPFRFLGNLARFILRVVSNRFRANESLIFPWVSIAQQIPYLIRIITEVHFIAGGINKERNWHILISCFFYSGWPFNEYENIENEDCGKITISEFTRLWQISIIHYWQSTGVDKFRTQSAHFFVFNRYPGILKAKSL